MHAIWSMDVQLLSIDKNLYIPSGVITRLLAKSALLPTRITAFCAMFSDVHKDCSILSAITKLLLSDAEYMTQYPCGLYVDIQFSGYFFQKKKNISIIYVVN